MIFGIGTDIVEIKRIKTMTSLDKFASKILSHNEKEFYDSLTNQKQIVYISKQFAAKEAIAKAIGTGIRNDTNFKNIEILRDKNGAPIFNALNKLEKIISDLGITKTHVSVADERDYAIAIPVLEKAAEMSKDGKSYVLLGNLYLSEDKVSEAVDAIKKGLKKGDIKKLSQVYLTLGQAYFELQEFEEAKKNFRIAARDKEKKIKTQANNWIKYTENEEIRVKNLALRRDYIQMNSSS